MSNSKITKRAYAESLCELMQKTPLEKITVSQVCEKCGMSRKSFYYHFKDKYDVVAWIFDEDCIDIINNNSFTPENFLDILCGYFYKNRDFYKRALSFQGQNSFSEHFEKFMHHLIQGWLQNIFDQENVPSICIDIIAGGFVSSIRRWLLERDCIPAEQFTAALKTLKEKVKASYSQEA